MNTNDDDKNKGLYQKYRVERTDGSSAPGGKHEKCRYFVLDLDHDPHAKLALKGYVISCRQYYPELAKDLDDVIDELERRKQSNPPSLPRSTGVSDHE